MKGQAHPLLWDLPVRLLHWVFAIGFFAAFGIALLAEHGALFPLHMLIGLALAFAVVLRLVWAVVGSRHARVRSFLVSPRVVASYFMRLGRPETDPNRARNPASAYAVIAMLMLLAIIITTGMMMSQGIEAGEELHGLAAWLLVVVAGVHVVGVVVHAVRHRDGLGLSMFTGRRDGTTGLAIPSARPVSALVTLGLLGLFSFSIYRNYDAAKRHTHLPLLGATISLGEAESEHERPERGTPRARHDDDDD